MILKDRHRSDYDKGHNKHNKRDREPYRRFNKGCCSFGLSCKFDHHCSVKKCGKFGQAAHICRLRYKQTSNSGESGSSGARVPDNSDK